MRASFGHHLAVLLLVLVCAVAVLLGGCGGALEEAAGLQRQGDLEGALAIYERLLADDPNDLEALENAAVCLLLLNRHSEALILQERLVAIDPTNVQVRVELGFNYLNHQNTPEEAIRVFAEAATLEPSAKNQCFLAQAQLKGEHFEEAERTLREAISSEATYARSYQLLVALLQAQGRTQEAAVVVQQAASHGVDINKSS